MKTTKYRCGCIVGPRDPIQMCETAQGLMDRVAQDRDDLFDRDLGGTDDLPGTAAYELERHWAKYHVVKDHEPSPRDYKCLTCGANAGSPCQRPSGHTVFGGGFHRGREEMFEFFHERAGPQESEQVEQTKDGEEMKLY